MISHAYAKTLLGQRMDAAIAKARQTFAFEKADYFEQKTKISLDFKKSRTTTMASNVLGVIEGSDKKDEFVFVTAHYDHIGITNGKINNGADDDGSGTVAVMQIGEAFLKTKQNR